MTTYISPKVCWVCHHKEFKAADFGQFYQCQHCGQMQRIPVPPFHSTSNPYHSLSPQSRHGLAARWVRQHSNMETRLLDAHAERGEFLSLAGVQRSLGLTEKGEEQYVEQGGHRAISVNFSHRGLAEIDWNFIYFWRVLERTIHPQTQLFTALDYLAPRGCLIVTVPNFDCAAAKKFKDNFNFALDEGTVQLFSPDSLRSALEAHGFGRIKIKFPWRGMVTPASAVRMLFYSPHIPSPFWRKSLITALAWKL